MSLLTSHRPHTTTIGLSPLQRRVGQIRKAAQCTRETKGYLEVLSMFVMHISRVLLVLVLPTSQALDCLTVDTTSGLVQGSIDSISPNVAHFLGVPYAEQPVGARRWLPSTPAVRQHKVVIDATQFGPACPQLDNNRSTLWSVDAPQFGIIPRDYVGEDCLSVNIWAPWKKKRSKGLLPVIAWIHGGSFQTGGASVPYQNPSRWVERTGRHIVVGIK